jgi:nitroreductase
MDREEILQIRKPGHGVDPIFPLRWSPRAMSGEPLGETDLMKLLEAARWAPSAFNNQPWRFLYSVRDDRNWPTFYGLLKEKNSRWCRNAGALIVMVSKTTFDHSGTFSRTHSFDTGAAWMSLALQGSLLGLVVHGMQGFDYDRAREELNVPEDHQVEAMCAVGYPGGLDLLDKDFHENERPKGRKELGEIARPGGF